MILMFETGVFWKKFKFMFTKTLDIHEIGCLYRNKMEFVMHRAQLTSLTLLNIWFPIVAFVVAMCVHIVLFTIDYVLNYNQNG